MLSQPPRLAEPDSSCSAACKLHRAGWEGRFGWGGVKPSCKHLHLPEPARKPPGPSGGGSACSWGGARNGSWSLQRARAEISQRVPLRAERPSWSWAMRARYRQLISRAAAPPRRMERRLRAQPAATRDPEPSRNEAGKRLTRTGKHSNWWLLGDFPSLGSAPSLAAAGMLPGPPLPGGSTAVTAEGLSLLQCNARDGQRGQGKGCTARAARQGTRPQTPPHKHTNSHGNLATHCSRRTRSPRGPPPPRVGGTWPAAGRASCHTPRKAGPRPRPPRGAPRRG